MPEAIEKLHKRAVTGGRNTFNEEDRTVEVCWTTGAKVKRYSWDEGYYMEELAVDKKAIRLDRFNAMSVLDAHERESMDKRLGTVVPGSVRIEGGKGYATIKLSRKQRAEELLQDLRDGHPLPISVGYKIHQFEKTEGADGQLPLMRAIDWEPLELSAVPIPADAGAISRSEEHNMPDDIQEHPIQQQRQAPTNIVAERTRVRDLRQLARFASFSEEELDEAIERGESVDAFRARAFQKVVERQSAVQTFPHVETRGMGGRDERYEEQARARQEALFARMSGTAPEGEARHFMSHSLLDHARGLLEAQGIDTRMMSREQLLGYQGRGLGGMHATSDFPLLLQGAGERVLMAAYQAAQSPLKTLLSRQSTANDFRAKTKLSVSDGGLLEKVNESGEIKSMTRSETSQSYKIESYGRIFALSFQAIVNDDLGAFSDWSVHAGQMAALTENKIMLDLLLANAGNGPTMDEDSKSLFHADHGNLAASGTALDETNLGAAILAFRKQKAAGGHRITVAPKYLLVGPELEITAQKLVASINPTTTADAVPDAIKALVPVVEPNLDGKSWRVFGDPSAAPIFEHAYLSGHEGVQLATQEGFERLGTQFRAVLHFGAGAIGWRGAYRNPGL